MTVQAEPIDLVRQMARASFGSFFRVFPPSNPYCYGRHTTALLQELDSATARMRAGESTYLIFNMPPRHGKTDVVSRSFPVWYHGNFPEHEIIMTSYSGDLVNDLSRAARRRYAEFSPFLFGARLDPRSSRTGSWRGEHAHGCINAVGLGGAITGRGAHVLIIDDYCRNREEAESITMREKIWDSFRSDLWSRLAPVHAVIICATRWHEDDLVGRIYREQKDNSEFPSFKTVRFPAHDERTGEWLFPERFPPEWYLSTKSAVGQYAWQALYQNAPQARHGNLLKTNGVRFISPSDAPTNLKTTRGWDLASTERERIKDDPDYTVGTKIAYDKSVNVLYVLDVVRGQWEAPERNKKIIEAAERDGRGTDVRIEAVAGYKDAYTTIRQLLGGKAVVRSVTPNKDKVARASILEPLFDDARVVCVRGPWNDDWMSEIGGFPSSAHDDQVDSLVVASYIEITAKGRTSITT